MTDTVFVAADIREDFSAVIAEGESLWEERGGV